MKYDVLLFTRGRREDYSWVYRPEYVDSSVDTLLRTLFMAIENQSNRQLFENHGNKNLFFMKERNYCILVYLYFTERYDMAGRRIYALEGLACRKSQCREFWKALPYLIEALYDGTLENRYYFYEEELSSKRESRLTIEMHGAERHMQEGYEEILQKYKNFDYSFLNMIEEMHFTNRMYSFVYGNHAEYLKNRTVERSYQMGETRKKYRNNIRESSCCPSLKKKNVVFLLGLENMDSIIR